VNVMAQETDEGLVYLQARKGSAPPPDGRADPASEPNSTEASERAPAQTSAAQQTFALEKRHGPRYASEGSMVNTPPRKVDEGLAHLQALKQAAPTAVGASALAPNSEEAPWRAQVHNSASPKLSFSRSTAAHATSAKGVENLPGRFRIAHLGN
jgi:hypothetical protein